MAFETVDARNSGEFQQHSSALQEVLCFVSICSKWCTGC